MGKKKKTRKKFRLSPIKVISVNLIIIILLVSALVYSQDSGDFPWDSHGSSLPDPGSAEVHFIDVGQGDSTLIRTSDGCILIDAGANSAEEELRFYLDSLMITDISYCIFTHPDEDHIGGGDMILKKFHVDHVIIPDVSSDSASYTRLLAAITDTGPELTFATVGQTYSVGSVVLTVLSPDGSPTENTNDYSVVVTARIGEVSFMLQGDAENAVEDRLVKSFPLKMLDCTVLKTGHHGSSTSSGEKWLDAVSPEYAVISCGAGNTYGHPHLLTLTRLQKRGIGVYRTDENGSVVFYTDGNDVTVRCQKKK